MTEHERNTDFLRRMILFDQEHRKLEADILQLRRKQLCVQRAVQLMILVVLISAAAFGYGAVLERNFLRTSRYLTTFVCALGLASPICLGTFLMLLAKYRRDMNSLLEECRQLITKVMEYSLGRLRTTTVTGSRTEAVILELAPLPSVRNAEESLPLLAD